MAGSVNKAIIIGRLGRDPEVRRTQSGDRIANLSVATSERWKDKSGEKKERTEWHKVTIMNDALSGIAESYLRKGSVVYIEGQIETRKWQDKDGQDRYSTEIILRNYGGTLTLMDAPGQSGEASDTHQRAKPGKPTTSTTIFRFEGAQA